MATSSTSCSSMSCSSFSEADPQGLYALARSTTDPVTAVQIFEVAAQSGHRLALVELARWDRSAEGSVARS